MTLSIGEKVAKFFSDVVADLLNLKSSTARKWKNRDSVADKSHRPKQIQTDLTEAQESIIVLVRTLVKEWQQELRLSFAGHVLPPPSISIFTNRRTHSAFLDESRPQSARPGHFFCL
ncbi:MAG: hypothetical protein HW380_3214 [Magnetococcales bacterium]|nr:hypothetical protein [Magnetococcales bacterium]